MPSSVDVATTPPAGVTKDAPLQLSRHGKFHRLHEPVDIASLVVFRIFFGAIMVWEVARYFSYDWIRRYYIDPTFYFTYYGFGWLRPWPGDGMHLHFAVLGVLALFITVGLFYRVSTVLFAFGFTYVFLLDQANYLNHFYLVSLISFLLVFVPAHRGASLDAWLRPALRSETVPAWALWVMRAQLGLVYFYAGVAKLNADWLHGEPMRMWLARRSDQALLGGLLPVGKLFTEEWVVYGFAYGGLLLDLFITPALLWRRTRPFAFAAGILFHLLNAWLFDIGIFPWFASAGMLLFFSPDWPRRILNWPRGPVLDKPASGSAPRWRLEQAAVMLLGVHMVLQVLIPLRHLLYPGEVGWTEEGHRFSWHMKLRDKSATASFEATDPATGKSWTIQPRSHLTTRQARKLATRPDMILQFAHFLAEQARRDGHAQVEVRAKVMASLNKRAKQWLIDPTVNLAAERRTLGHAAWIVPLTQPLPSPGERVPIAGPESDE